MRTVQEGLTNVLKHAGAGARCAVRLTWAETSLHVTRAIAAHPAALGALGPASRSGWSTYAGLSGLAERAALVGGHLGGRTCR